jgi:hypothetical protein
VWILKTGPIKKEKKKWIERMKIKHNRLQLIIENKLVNTNLIDWSIGLITPSQPRAIRNGIIVCAGMSVLVSLFDLLIIIVRCLYAAVSACKRHTQNCQGSSTVGL